MRIKREKIEHGALLKAKRYLVEQFNGHVKDDVLKERWIRPRGLVKKAAMVTAGLISINASAIEAIIEGKESLKAMSKQWD